MRKILGTTLSRAAAVGLLAMTLVVTALLCGLLWATRTTRSAPFPGTTFGGYRPDDSLFFSDWLELQRRQFGEQLVRVTADGFTLDVPASKLGIEIDVAQMLQVSSRQTHSGSWLSRVDRALGARFDRIDYAWLTRFDRDTARATIAALAPAVEHAPIDAEVDLAHRRQIHAAMGSRLDVEGTLDFVESHRSVELEWVPLTLLQVPPRVRDDDATGVDVERVLSHFETDFRTRAGTRAVNIRVAARALQGQILAPGATFSFNHAVGPRIETRGYREAPVIVDDELEPGVGGGVCQVATTLHAAAVLGGLEIIQRRSHSRPSGYAPLGLDATVIDGQVDLKLRNPYAVPISIATSFPEQFRIRIEFLGLTLPARVEHTYAVSKRYDFYRRVVTKAELTAGTFKKKQKGNFGFDVTSTVLTHRGDGTSSRRQYRSRYWPVPEVYWVGADTDLAVLPPLPEGATGVQRDGTTIMGTIPEAVEERAGKAEPGSDSLEQ